MARNGPFTGNYGALAFSRSNRSGAPFMISRGGSESATAEDTGVEEGVEEEEDDMDLDDKVAKAMKKLGLLNSSEPNCKNGVCEIPTDLSSAPVKEEEEEEEEEEEIAKSEEEIAKSEEEIAIDISKEMNVNSSIAFAALAASNGNAELAREIIAYEVQSTCSVSDDSEDLAALVEEGYDAAAAKRALALSELNVNDARAILEAEAEDERLRNEEMEKQRQAEEEARMEAARKAKAERDAQARAEAESKMKTVTIPANFDPTSGGMAKPPQQQPQSSPQGAPKEAKKEDVVFEVTGETLQKLVLESPVPVLLDIYADWCGPCKALTPALEQMAIKSGGMFRLAKLNTDNDRAITSALGVTALPTVMGINNGIIQNSFQGMPTEESLKAFLMALLTGSAPSPPKTQKDLENMADLSSKLAKMAGAAAFPFSARERLQERISSRLDDLVLEHHGDMAAADESARILRTLLSNIVNKPSESKFRKVNLNNAKIQSKVGAFTSCLTILKNVGFVKDNTTDGKIMLLGKGKPVINVAPVSIARDCIDKWADINRYNIAKAARKRKDEIARARLAKEREERGEQSDDEEDQSPQIVKPDPDAAIIKLRFQGKKKTHEFGFHADDPLRAILHKIDSVLNGESINDTKQLQITCAARRLIIKSLDDTKLDQTFRDLRLSPTASLVVKIGAEPTAPATSETTSLAERAAAKKEKKKKGSHTMQTTGIYSKDDDNKMELIDGGGGVWYEHDVSDDEPEKEESADQTNSKDSSEEQPEKEVDKEEEEEEEESADGDSDEE